MPGTVTIRHGGGGNPALITIADGDVALSGLELVDAPTAVDVRPEADRTRLSRLRIVNTTVVNGNQVTVRSSDVDVVASQFISEAGAARDAIDIAAANLTAITIEGNVFFGPFENAIDVDAGAEVLFSHNSVFMPTGFAVEIEGAAAFCARNNIFAGSVAWDLAATPLPHPGCTSGGNVVDSDTACVGGSGACPSWCGNGGPYCDLALAPLFLSSDEALCLDPSSPAVDGAADVGVDLVDDPDALYLGADPDLGARESGGTRTFGTFVSTCP